MGICYGRRVLLAVAGRRRVGLDRLVLGLSVLWLTILCGRRWRRRRSGCVRAEQAAEEAGVLHRLLRLLLELFQLLVALGELLVEVVELLLGVVERVLLDEDGLGQDVERVGVTAEVLEEELFGFGILVGELGLVDPVGEAFEQVVFLRCHFVSSI